MTRLWIEMRRSSGVFRIAPAYRRRHPSGAHAVSGGDRAEELAQFFMPPVRVLSPELHELRGELSIEQEVRQEIGLDAALGHPPHEPPDHAGRALDKSG